MKFKAPRGTRDILPEEAGLWLFLEENIRKISRRYGYGEIRTPVFEHTEIFARSVGEETDIVSKEMYSFMDRGDRELTLRPEGTAAVVRAYLENNLNAAPQPVKLYYYGSMFRYDRPQSGRYRQFYQFGTECFGAAGAPADVEVIRLGVELLASLGLSDTVLHLNSIGCQVCRETYREKLLHSMEPYTGNLCVNCRNRLHKNPLRVLDCKREECRKVAGETPNVTDYLCGDCITHFEQVRYLLTELGIGFELNPRMVRGLDYYTRTAFEFISGSLSEAQNAVGGGGRYDNLVETFGGPPTPAVGMAMGLDRILLSLRDREKHMPVDLYPRVFVAVDGDARMVNALQIAGEIRSLGLAAEVEYMDRSLKAQMKFAGKQGFNYVVIVGEREQKEAKFLFKDMDTGKQEAMGLPELIKKLKSTLSVPDKEGI